MMPENDTSYVVMLGDCTICSTHSLMKAKKARENILLDPYFDDPDVKIYVKQTTYTELIE